MHCLSRRALIGALALLGVLSVAALSPSRTAAAEELETRTITAYDVRSDGSVHVTVAAQVTNRDPSTQRRSTGRVFYYSTAAFAVHHAAANLSARTAGGTRLVMDATSDARDSGDPFRVVAVRFDRDLYYNDAIELTLEYDLAAVRAAQLLVNRQYAFIPAIGQGTQSLVRITAPADRQLTVGSSNCTRIVDAPVTYACGASTTASDYRAGGRCAFTVAAPRWECAFSGRDFVVIPFEATAADLALAARTSRVPLKNGPVEVTVRHFAGEEAWAARVDELIRRGLPLLEEANGYPYPGPAAIEIVESGYRDTHGYEGLTSSQGRIRLTPVVEDQTVLHEVAHLWSGIFASRWLAEGIADYTANAAARRLGLRPETVKEPLPSTPILEEWGPLRSQIAVSRADRDREEAGYARSLRFVELLAERVGTRALAAANTALAQEHTRASARTYLDLLEDSTKLSLAPLFAEWALTPGDVELLPLRQRTRADVEALRERARRLDLSAPADVEGALRAWRFDEAAALTATANEALDLHEQTTARARSAALALGDRFPTVFGQSAAEAAALAQQQREALEALQRTADRLTARRSPIMRAGLVGSEPDRDFAAASAALSSGDYETATARATALERRLDNAGRDGLLRVSAAGALLVLAVFVLRRASGRRSAPRLARSSRPSAPRVRHAHDEHGR